jgi:hypothetical protein
MPNTKVPKWIKVKIAESTNNAHVRSDIICAFIKGVPRLDKNGMPVITTVQLYSIQCTNGLNIITTKMEADRVKEILNIPVD